MLTISALLYYRQSCPESSITSGSEVVINRVDVVEETNFFLGFLNLYLQGEGYPSLCILSSAPMLLLLEFHFGWHNSFQRKEMGIF